MNRPALRAVLFDLDGTLVDSAPDIAQAANRALIAMGYEPRPLSQVTAFIGDGAEQLIHRCLTGDPQGRANAALHAETYQHFQAHYATGLLDNTRVYPGVIETLEGLGAHGIALACVTNKPERFTRPLLDGLGLSCYFKVTLGGDSLPTKKPDSAPLLHAAGRCGANYATAAMVGDSLIDLRAARAAKMPIYCVKYGYSANIDLASHAPDALLSNLPELLTLLLN
ncbi:MAG: phosphoglycolate phosphatase [Gammaproteobacteria bacterium]|nr:phosphoglycolate phosphatase [Gammaproteobacteria bacterium]